MSDAPQLHLLEQELLQEDSPGPGMGARESSRVLPMQGEKSGELLWEPGGPWGWIKGEGLGVSLGTLGSVGEQGWSEGGPGIVQVLGEGEEKPLVPFHIPGGAWSCEGTGNIPDTARLVGITSMSHPNHSEKVAQGIFSLSAGAGELLPSST